MYCGVSGAGSAQRASRLDNLASTYIDGVLDTVLLTDLLTEHGSPLDHDGVTSRRMQGFG